jgi:hypothetical protein
MNKKMRPGMRLDTIRIIAAQLVMQLTTAEVFRCAKSESEANNVLAQYRAGDLAPTLEDAQYIVNEVHQQSRESLVAMCQVNNWKLEVR